MTTKILAAAAFQTFHFVRGAALTYVAIGAPYAADIIAALVR
jgi:hypothetical protein